MKFTVIDISQIFLFYVHLFSRQIINKNSYLQVHLSLSSNLWSILVFTRSLPTATTPCYRSAILSQRWTNQTHFWRLWRFDFVMLVQWAKKYNTSKCDYQLILKMHELFPFWTDLTSLPFLLADPNFVHVTLNEPISVSLAKSDVNHHVIEVNQWGESLNYFPVLFNLYICYKGINSAIMRRN